nr:coactosin-like protein isoform X1 [Cherax quadricarinatus]
MTADVQVQEEVVRRVMAMTQVDRDGLRDAYSDVRDDKSECNWAVFKYDGSQVIVSAKGETFDDFKAQFGDDERAFAYIRLQTGDEMKQGGQSSYW